MGRKQPQTTDLSPGSLPPDHILVQLGIPRGSNNFTCIDTTGGERLYEISSKIRKTVLATRGDYAIAHLFPAGPDEPKSTEKTGSLVGEIVFVASNKDVKEWKKAGEWPEGFGEVVAPIPSVSKSEPGVEAQDQDQDQDQDQETGEQEEHVVNEQQ